MVLLDQENLTIVNHLIVTHLTVTHVLIYTYVDKLRAGTLCQSFEIGQINNNNMCQAQEFRNPGSSSKYRFVVS